MHNRSRAPFVSVVLAAVLLAGACTGRNLKAGPSPTPTVGPATPTATATTGLTPTATSGASPAPSSAGPAAPAPSPIAWKGCSPSGFQCGTLAVPLDWAHPTAGRTVKLSLTRLPTSGAKSQRIGSLFVNPGGPGASAVEFAKAIQNILPVSLLRRFDIVAFDPRGVGTSQPLSCLTGPAMDAFLALNPDPTTDADIQAVVDGAKQFAAGCVRQYGTDFLAHVDTATAARDMDYIRAALGEAKLTYLGYSYGTLLGAHYANLFPTHVRAAVLDGAVDPSLVGLQFSSQQAAGFDKELADLFAACTPGCPFYSNGDPKGAFTQLMQRVTATPIKVGSRLLALANFLNGVADGLYSPSSWSRLQRALQAATSGDGSQLLAMSDALANRSPNGQYDALSSAILAVDCVDSVYPKGVDAYKAEAAKAAQQAPIFGPAIVWGSLPCSFWPVPPAIQPGPLKASGSPPILVIGTTADPATPYAWAQGLASQLENGVLLTHVGEGHTSLGQGSSCVDGAVENYVINLMPPAKDSTCGSGTAPPRPSATAAQVAFVHGPA